jgi:hypothetical protein
MSGAVSISEKYSCRMNDLGHDTHSGKPRTLFTRAGNFAIACKVVGDGLDDLVYASGWLHNIDAIWEHP